MNGDVHVRFCESQGLQCPWPLAKKATVKKKAKHHGAKKGKAGKH